MSEMNKSVYFVQMYIQITAAVLSLLQNLALTIFIDFLHVHFLLKKSTGG